MKLLDNLKDWYFTKKTGKDKSIRKWDAWYKDNVNYRAHDITNMFENFEYVIKVDPNKFFILDGPFPWMLCDDAKQYFWPQKELGNNAVWRAERVMWDKWSRRWQINEIGGEDSVFVATNDRNDAVMIALKWT